jgi:predicted nucleic acid-binding protein
MISLDTDCLILLWRSQGRPEAPVRRALAAHLHERLVVCLAVAGEFLEGAAFISEERFREAVRFLNLFEQCAMSLETAGHYARIAADLRRRRLLDGVSKADVWIAAWAIEHGAWLATRNRRRFARIAGLKILAMS